MKLNIQYFSAAEIHSFTVTKTTENNQVTVKITPDTSDVGDLGVDVNGNHVYIDDSCEFSLEGWTKVNDGNGSLSKVYTSNTTEDVSVDYTTTNAHVVTFEATVTITEIGTEPTTTSYEPYTWENDEEGNTPVSAENLNHMEIGIYNVDKTKISKTVIELLSVSDTAPTTCSTGDMYYNTTTNLIYTATDTNTWGTIGSSPVSTYLYVDLTNSKLYYYDGTNFKSYGGGSGSINVNNDKSTSTTETYSCNYINKFDDIGKVVNLFGNVMGTDGPETISCYAHVVATKINETDWKFEIEGQMDIQNPTSNFLWGFDIPKISNLLNSAIGVQVEFNENLRTLGNWNIVKTSDKLPYVNLYQYGTTFEHNSNYFLPARYYTTEGDTGGYPTLNFENTTHVYATVYLKEVQNG